MQSGLSGAKYQTSGNFSKRLNGQGKLGQTFVHILQQAFMHIISPGILLLVTKISAILLCVKNAKIKIKGCPHCCRVAIKLHTGLI